MATVLIAPTTLAIPDAPFLKILRDAGLDYVFPSRPVLLTEEDLLTELKGISAALAGTEPYTQRVMANCPGLKVIARAGVGYDAVDVASASDHGIVVTITPGANQDSVAEHTMAMLLGLAKNIAGQHTGTKAGGWPRTPTVPLRGKILGIAGLGRIGKALAIRAAAFSMQLLAYEPYPDLEFVHKHHIMLVPMEKLFAESDFLSLHVPLGPATRHLINRESLALMKPSAFLINTARGGMVCEADLYEALCSRKIAGAALDVFEQEPPVNNPLFELDNVLLTAHTAGVDTQSLDNMASQAARCIATLSGGGWPAIEVVNPEVRDVFHW